MTLEAELAHFESIKDELLKHHEGKFALIVDTELLGVFDSDEAAYRAGLDKRGNVPMLIKPITGAERMESVPAMTLGLIGARL
jgi:hypothetical protein